MTETLPTLTPKQRRGIEALLQHGEIKAAAAEAGVNRSTMYEWLKQPLFAATLKEAEADAIAEISRRLTLTASKAVGVAEDLLTREGVRDDVRLRAADVVLARLLQLRELVNLETQLAQLELAVAEKM